MGIWEELSKPCLIISHNDNNDNEVAQLREQNKKLKELLLELRNKRVIHNVEDSDESEAIIEMPKRIKHCSQGRLCKL